MEFPLSKTDRNKIQFLIPSIAHRRTASDVQKGRGGPKDARPAGGSPLKLPYGHFRTGLPAGCRRVGHGGPHWYSRESMATPCLTPMPLLPLPSLHSKRMEGKKIPRQLPNNENSSINHLFSFHPLHWRMASGGHGLPKVSLEPTMPHSNEFQGGCLVISGLTAQHPEIWCS
jgi:hypothetical protein